jgi:hypothetical protein
MKKLLILLSAVILVLPLFSFSACNNSGGKVKFWITQKNADDPELTTIASDQSNNVTFWACGTTEEEISCRVGIFLEGKTIYFDTNIVTQGKDQAFAVGGVINPLPGGNYVIKAVTKTGGEEVGSLDFTVTGSKDLYPTPTPMK